MTSYNKNIIQLQHDSGEILSFGFEGLVYKTQLPYSRSNVIGVIDGKSIQILTKLIWNQKQYRLYIQNPCGTYTLFYITPYNAKLFYTWVKRNNKRV